MLLLFAHTQIQNDRFVQDVSHNGNTVKVMILSDQLKSAVLTCYLFDILLEVYISMVIPKKGPVTRYYPRLRPI